MTHLARLARAVRSVVARLRFRALSHVAALAITLAAGAFGVAPPVLAVQYLSSIDFIVGGPNGNTSLMKGSLDGGPNRNCSTVDNTEQFYPAPFVFHDGNPGQSYHYRSFDLWNNGPARCVTVDTEWRHQNCSGLNIGISLYLGSFDPNDPTKNLLSHSHNVRRDFFDVGQNPDLFNNYMHSPGFFHDAASQYHLEYYSFVRAVVPALQKVVVVLDSQARSPQDTGAGLRCPIDPATASFGLKTKNLDTVPLEVSVNNSSSYEYQLGQTPKMQFYVKLSTQMNVPFTVHYATANGNAANPAIAGTDYVAKSGDLTFQPGETLKLVEVDVIGNNVKQPDRTFRLLLSNPQPGSVALMGGGAVVGTIYDDDLGPDEKCRITNFVGAGDLPQGAVGKAYGPVTLIGNTPPLVDPDYKWQIVDPQNLPPGLALSQTSPANNPSGDNKGVLSGTTTKAGTYNFTVRLTCPEVQGDNTVIDAIVNQPMQIVVQPDIPPTIITLADVAIVEGHAGKKTVLVPVTLSSPLAQDTVFELVLIDGSASTADADYVQFAAIPQPFLINAGVLNGNPIPIEIVGDKNIELNETLIVQLRTTVSKTVLASATVTIINDDAATIPLEPARPIPTLHPLLVALMALMLAIVGMVARRRR